MIFYSDVDDTLMLNGTPSKQVEEMFEILKKTSHIFIPCSGRPTSNLINTFEKMDTKYVIGFNGAQVYDIEKKEMIIDNSFSKREVIEVIDYLKEKEIDYILYDDKELYTNNENNEYAQVERDLNFLKLSNMTDAIPSGKILGLNAPETIDLKIKDLKIKFPDLEISKSKPFFIEITKKGINKGATITKFTELLKGSKEEVTVFGDSDNDISMFETEYKKIAVKNANENILKRADEVCDSCEENGVVKYVLKRIEI